jgi:hypothetical protein
MSMGRYKMKITETIFDVITQKTTILEREMTAEEVAERDAAAAEQAQQEAEKATKETARQVVLSKLGLTAEEVETLLS